MLTYMSVSLYGQSDDCNKVAERTSSETTKYKYIDANAEQLRNDEVDDKKRWSLSDIVSITYDTDAKYLYIDYPNQVFDISVDSIMLYGLDYLEIQDIIIHDNPNYNNRKCPKKIYTGIIYRSDDIGNVQCKYMYDVYTYTDRKPPPDEDFKKMKEEKKKIRRKKRNKGATKRNG